MADELNAAGHRTPHDRSFTADSVRQLLARGGPRPAQARRASERPQTALPRWGLETLSSADHRGLNSRTAASPGRISPGLCIEANRSSGTLGKTQKPIQVLVTKEAV